jgi:hypothetical protein
MDNLFSFVIVGKRCFIKILQRVNQSGEPGLPNKFHLVFFSAIGGIFSSEKNMHITLETVTYKIDHF